MASRDNDLLDELTGSACDLLAESQQLSWCAVLLPEDHTLLGASRGFGALPRDSRTALFDEAARVASDLAGRPAAESDSVATATLDLGDGGNALMVSGSDCVLLAQPAAQGDADAQRDRLVSVLPMFTRIAALWSECARVARRTELLSHIEDLTQIGGWEHSVGTDRLVWSEQVYAIHGLDPGSEITLDRMLELYPSPSRETLSLEIERASANGGTFSVTTPIRTPSGESRVVRNVGVCRSDDRGLRLYGIAQDVTNQIATERRLWWAANHDPVTSLPNRLLFEDRIGVAVRRARRESRRIGLVVIEIADFARITERAGYTVPDKHMLEVASRLAAVTRESDTIARISFNVFALLLWDVDEVGTMNSAMGRLKEQFAAVKAGDNGGDSMLISAGIAFYPTHARGPEELLRAAEIALSRARRKLDTPIAVFEGQFTDDTALRQDTILARARESLGRREFVPYYQPQFDMETREVIGVEALVRWRTPDMTLDAKDFTYALDDHEVGSRVGRAVLEAVIADIAELRRITDRHLRVSINASRTELLRNDFLDTFLDKTRRGNLKPDDFIIEITEDVIIGVDDITLQDKISYLVSSGVEFALDDFGTGYASLIHISSFPVKEIKIDKQFIAGIETDQSKQAIIKGILQIAEEMGLTVIAEGVETAAQQAVLREIGCRYAQGYLYCFPIPFAQFAAMLDNKDQWTKPA